MYASFESPENLFTTVVHFKKTNVPLMIPCLKNDMDLQYFWKCKHKIKTRETYICIQEIFEKPGLLPFKNEIKMIKPSRNQNLSYDWSRFFVAVLQKKCFKAEILIGVSSN